jgi:hypothetical protein
MKRIALCALALMLASVTAFAQEEPESQEMLSARLTAATAKLAKAQAELDLLERNAREAAARKTRAAAAATAAQAQPVIQARADTATTYPEPTGVYNDEHGAPLQIVKIAANKKYDPLRLKMVMRFPANVKTIQQATQYMLETVDYKLTLSPLNPNETRQILSRPLMPQDRIGGLQTIEDGLLQISGDDTVLIIDRANKLISFELQGKKSK